MPKNVATIAFVILFGIAPERCCLCKELRHNLTIDSRKRVNSLEFHANDSEIISAGGDEINFWSVESGKLLRTMRVPGGVAMAALSPNGKSIAAVNREIIKLWDLESGEIRSTFKTKSEYSNIAFSPCGDFLAVAGNDRRVYIQSLAPGGTAITLRDAIKVQVIDCTLNVRYSHDGKSLFVATPYDVSQFDVSSGKDTKLNSRLRIEVGRLGALASTNYENKSWHISIWNGKNSKGVTRCKLTDSDGPPCVLKFNPDESILASGGDGLSLWNVATGNRLFLDNSHEELTMCIDVSRDGRLLASSGGSKIKVWRVIPK